MKPPPISAITSSLLGFLVMAALGWLLATPSPNQIGGQTESAEAIRRNHSRPTRPTRDIGLVARQMRAVRDAGSPTERLRMTVSLANSLPPSEFAAWMEGDRFNFRKGPELDVFRMIIFERWINEDPDSLIPWASKNNYGQAGRALLSLAKDDPQRLIDHYRGNPNDKAELQILDEVAKNHPALALQRLQELSAKGLPSGTTGLARSLLNEIAKNSPAALETVMTSLAPDLQEAAESALSGQRLATSFPTEIRALWERPDGWRIFDNNASGNRELSNKLVAEIANLPESWKSGIAGNYYNYISEKNGREWINADLEQAGFTASQAKTMKDWALREMASSDPEFALRSLTESNFDASTRQEVISNAIRNARDDSEKIDRLIEMMTSEEDRQYARNQLKLADLTESGSKSQKPADWLEKFGGIDGAQGRPYEILNQLRNWDKAKIAELRTGFNELPAHQQQNIARLVAAGGMYAQVDPGFAGDAIRALVTNPPVASSINDRTPGNDPVMASSTYAVELSITDPSAATSWINTLPDGDAKLWAFKNVASNWQQYEPKAVDQWVKSLPLDAREQVKKHLEKSK